MLAWLSRRAIAKGDQNARAYTFSRFERVSKIVAWKIGDNHRDQYDRSKEKSYAADSKGSENPLLRFNLLNWMASIS